MEAFMEASEPEADVAISPSVCVFPKCNTLSGFWQGRILSKLCCSVLAVLQFSCKTYHSRTGPSQHTAYMHAYR